MDSTPLWPFVIYAISVFCVAAGMLVISFFLGQRHQDRQTGLPYESGIQSTGSARVRLSIKFYLVAILFVIFDLEMVFVFSWAVVMKSLGWSGYFAILTFLAILIIALIYEWKMGFLDWNRPPEKHSTPSKVNPSNTLKFSSTQS